jgi:hypothetical protein
LPVVRSAEAAEIAAERGQFVQAIERSAQSPTHSFTLPTMSNAPQTDLQLAREPVSAGPAELVTHVVAPSSGRSGVPAAAPCHSRLVSSRFPDSRHAWFAWNQVMHLLGSTPGMETA